MSFIKESLKHPLTAVQNTASDAAASKHCLSIKNYFPDPFVHLFCPESVFPRSPVINRGYYARVKALDMILSDFHRKFPAPEKQIVSLGAGFDTMFFRFAASENLRFSHYIEIDFPGICLLKSEMISKNNALCEHLSGTPNFSENGDVSSDNYSLIGCDLADVETLAFKLGRHNVRFDVPTLFLSECTLIYVDPDSSDKLIKWTASAFSSHLYFLVYEQIIANARFCQVMVQNLKRRGIDLRSLHKFPSLKSQVERFEHNGFERVTAKDMKDIYYNFLDKEDIKRVCKLELLDEFEELDLMQSNYCMVLAARKDTNGVSDCCVSLGFMNM